MQKISRRFSVRAQIIRSAHAKENIQGKREIVDPTLRETYARDTLFQTGLLHRSH